MGKQRRVELPSIDGIKTGIMGYDKEAVLEYVRLLLQQVDKDNEEELSRMSGRIKELESDRKRMRGQLDIYKENYEMLTKQLKDMTRAWERNAQYAAERDKLLREYEQKEESITVCLENAKQEAKRILDEAAQSKERMLEQANKECEQVVRQEQEKLAMCKLEIIKIVSRLLPIIEADREDGVRKLAYEDDYL